MTGMESLPETRFINVDLEVSSRTDLRWLVEEFGADATNLYCGEARGYFLATFETANVPGDPDGKIGYFCHLVECMPPEARQKWNDAFAKVFDLGYESGAGPYSFQSELRADTVAAVARVGASIRVTVYPVAPMELGLTKA